MTVPAAFFDDLYRRRGDPWGFATSWYERRKYDLTLASLTRPRYGSALELGCSIGVFTARLAGRCDALLAVDGSEVALAEARTRVAGAGGAVELPVELRRADLPGGYPGGAFDLVVFSEIGYFLSSGDLDAVVARIAGSLTPDGEVVAVHWRPPGDVYELDGDVVHDRLLAHPGLRSVASYREDSFRLDVLARA